MSLQNELGNLIRPVELASLAIQLRNLDTSSDPDHQPPPPREYLDDAMRLVVEARAYMIRKSAPNDT